MLQIPVTAQLQLQLAVFLSRSPLSNMKKIRMNQPRIPRTDPARKHLINIRIPIPRSSKDGVRCSGPCFWMRGDGMAPYNTVRYAWAGGLPTDGGKHLWKPHHSRNKMEPTRENRNMRSSAVYGQKKKGIAFWWWERLWPCGAVVQGETWTERHGCWREEAVARRELSRKQGNWGGKTNCCKRNKWDIVRCDVSLGMLQYEYKQMMSG